jgi:hypothetical protein
MLMHHILVDNRQILNDDLLQNKQIAKKLLMNLFQIYTLEQKLRDNDGMVIDVILQWLQHFGSSKVWKVFARHYNVHGKDMGSPS